MLYSYTRMQIHQRAHVLMYSEWLQGEESLSGKLISAGPILERIDIFGAAVAEKYAPVCLIVYSTVRCALLTDKLLLLRLLLQCRLQGHRDDLG